MNLAYLVDLHAEARPAAPALVGPGVACTWGELADRVRRLSGGLAALGIGAGDRVAVLSGNEAPTLEAYLALAWLGALVVPLNTRLAPAELEFQLDDAGARLIVASDALADLAARVAPGLPRVALGEGAGGGRETPRARLLAAAPAADPLAVAPDHALGIFYTGGTTGVPKGVVLTHQNLLSNATHVVPLVGLDAGEIYLHAAPMFHLADLGYLWAVVLAGGAHAFLGTWTPAGFVAAVERDRVTATLLAPAMIAMLVRAGAAEGRDLASWRRLLYGGAPITEDTLRRAVAGLPCGLWQGYGQTEATHTVCAMTDEDHAEALRRPERLAACGRPIRGVHVRVARVDLTPAAPGEPGEIVVRAPTVMRGYWNRPAETAEALAGGWLHTGDVARRDADGTLFLLDRRKDLIVTGGENVFSTEVEQALAAHPAVLEAAVIGVPDEVWGERVHAVVVLAPGCATTPEALAAHCRARIGGYKVPRSIEFAERLPRTASGKVQKAVLREPHWRGQTRGIH